MDIGGDYVGRDKIHNSDRWIKWVVFTFLAMTMVIAYWIYYFTVLYTPGAQPVPPEAPVVGDMNEDSD